MKEDKFYCVEGIQFDELWNPENLEAMTAMTGWALELVLKKIRSEYSIDKLFLYLNLDFMSEEYQYLRKLEDLYRWQHIEFYIFPVSGSQSITYFYHGKTSGRVLIIEEKNNNER